MHEDQMEMLQAIARMAADAIERETRNKEHHWAVVLRNFDPRETVSPPQVRLHGILTNAMDEFRRKPVVKTLDSYLTLVDRMRG